MSSNKIVHLALPGLLCLGVIQLNCEQKQETASDASRDLGQIPLDGGIIKYFADADSPLEQELGPEATQDGGEIADLEDSQLDETTGFFPIDNPTLVKATGRAKKGRDIQLSRDAAANRARKNLIEFLRKNGYQIESPGVLDGVAIERYIQKGRFIYAVAVVPLSQLPQKMNQATPNPSNSPGGQQTKKTIIP